MNKGKTFEEVWVEIEKRFREEFCDSEDEGESLCWADKAGNIEGVPCELEVIAFWKEEMEKQQKQIEELEEYKWMYKDLCD